MKKTFMKLTAIAIAVLLLTTALPFSASADTTIGYYGYYKYSISNDKAEITRCDESISGDITIPATLEGYPVTSIGSSAFGYHDSITSITIPDSVTSIGNNAFSGCSSLTSVKIGNGVKSIGGKAFYDCSSLTSVKIGNGVKSIGDGAFDRCDRLTSITIPDSVTSIGEQAFYGCSSLTSVKIGNGVTSIGKNAFSSCSSITNITVPDSVTSIGYGAFSWCKSLKSITIPDSVTSIGGAAFACCSSLTSVKIGKGVTSIDGSAFWACYSLTSITIPDSVTSIGDRAFYYCDSLTSITIPDSVTSIGDGAFSDCYSLKNVLYTGTEQQWKNIKIGSYNDCLSEAEIISAPIVQLIGATKLVVKATEGYEYSIDGEAWQSGNLFTGLVPGASYVVYARRTDLSEYTTVSLGASVITNGQDEVDTAPDSSNLVVFRKALISDFNNMALDYNADGEINILDFIRLKKYLCGMNVMLGNKESSVMSFAAAPRDTNTQSSKTPISEPYYSVASNINSEDITDRKIA